MSAPTRNPRRARPAAKARPARDRPEPAPELPLTHPATVLMLLVAAACLVVSVSNRISDPDVWQHLLVGRAIWETHGVPLTHQWTWPNLGQVDVLPSWGFRALLWPFYRLGGASGLYAWRGLTTLAAFALLWLAARRMGARGFSVFAVLVLGALVYRQRTLVRPETFVAVLIALELWILETRRRGGPDRTLLLPLLACVWVNAHISFFLGFVLLGAYAADDAWSHRRFPTRLAVVGLASLALTFLNPWGVRAVMQPIEFWLRGRGEAVYSGIGELRPVQWGQNLRNGLPLLVVAWPATVLAGLVRRQLDVASLLACTAFTALGLSSQRFLGPYAIVATPFVAAGVSAFVRARPWPRWTSHAGARLALATLACVGGSIPEWSRTDRPLGFALDDTRYPVAACDFMQRHGVRGRGFNPFHFGGYQLWRFWPERERLPFMDIHQTGSRGDRDLVAGAVSARAAWQALDARHHFDYALLDRLPVAGERTLEFLDADTAFALVFADDAGALYVRRRGRLAAVADSFAYGAWPAGREALEGVARAYVRDPAFRLRARADLEREVRSSPRHATASNHLANLALTERDDAGAERYLREALSIEPGLPDAHLRLGILALRRGRPDEAIAEFERERSQRPASGAVALWLGRAWSQSGNRDRARTAYEQALRLEPGLAAARESLAVLR